MQNQCFFRDTPTKTSLLVFRQTERLIQNQPYASLIETLSVGVEDKAGDMNKNTNDIIGWIGSTMFALCALPQCIKAWQTKSMTDFSWIFISMWLIGEILSFVYVFNVNSRSGKWQYPLLTNYVLNFILLSYLIFVKIAY